MQTAKKSDPKGQAGRPKNAERQSDDPENRGVQTYAHTGMLGITANSNTGSNTGGNALTFICKWGCGRTGGWGGGGRVKTHFGVWERTETGSRNRVGGHRWGTLNKHKEIKQKLGQQTLVPTLRRKCCSSIGITRKKNN